MVQPTPGRWGTEAGALEGAGAAPAPGGPMTGLGRATPGFIAKEEWHLEAGHSQATPPGALLSCVAER